MITVFIPNNPLLSPNQDGTWTLMADWRVWIDGQYYTIKQGFKTDGASIPRFLWRLCGHPMEAPRLYPAIIHDWFYSGGCPGVTRSYADAVFRDGQICVGIKKTHAYVEWLALRLCGRSHWKTENKKGKTEMKKVMMVAFAAFAAVLIGCTSSTSIKWGGKKAVRQPDGTVLANDKGVPYYESEPNEYEDSNWITKREERDVKVKVNQDGSYEAGIGSRVNDVSTNGIKMVTGGIDAMTKLLATCAAAYVTIAGGGAQADTLTATVTKMISYFSDKGGDASKATVAVDEAAKKLTISDGSTCIECNEAGVCSDCKPAAQ